MSSRRPRGLVAKVLAFFRELAQYLVQGWRNFAEYDAPFFRKVRLTSRNLWRRVQLQDSCCGNHGQPGC